MLDFKINMYFEKYKDTPIKSYTKFRNIFEKENGHFIYLREVYIMIYKYQKDRYGSVFDKGDKIDDRISSKIIKNREKGYLAYRFGSKEERNKRKLECIYGK